MSAPSSNEGRLDRVGVSSLYLFALSAFLARDVASVALLIMLVATLARWRSAWTVLCSRPLAPLVLISVALAFASAASAALSGADGSPRHWYGLGQFLQLWLFLTVAWWVAGKERRALLVLALALAGFVVGTLRALEPGDLDLLLNFRRPHFRWSINAIGQYCAAGLLGLVLVSNRLWQCTRNRWWTWPVRASAAGVVMLLMAGTVFSLSRGVWLALVAVSGLLAVLSAYTGLLRIPARLGRLGAVGFVLAALVILMGDNPVAQRVSLIVEPVHQYLATGGDLAAVEDESFTTRVRMVELAVDGWLQAPWIGLGPVAPEAIMEANRDRFRFGENFTDFHSLPMDLLVSYGLLGCAAMVAVLALVLWSAWFGFRGGCLPADLWLVVTGLTVFNILCQLTDTRIFDAHGRFFWILVSGVASSCWLHRRDTYRAEQTRADR